MTGTESAALPTFGDALDRRTADVAARCTACGECAAVCPTPAIAGIDAASPGALAAGVLDILKSADGPDASRAWAGQCCGSGHCLTVCPEGIDPRFMLLMARRALERNRDEGQRREAGKAAFKSMSRGVRVLSRMQLPPELLERLSPSSHPGSEEAPDLVFYTGCNLLKTPHIGLLCLDVLDRLGASYAVHGGPSSCCGILQMRPGDVANAGRQAYRTIDRLASTGASEVLSWCPTCQIQIGETALPGYESTRSPAFDMTIYPVYLERRLGELAPLMTRPVRKRVALYELPGSTGVGAAVRALLGAIPGLEVVDLGVQEAGFQITSLATVPAHRRASLARLLRDAREARIDTLAGIFHADHRELVAHEPEWPFEIVNYMELVGESLGITRPDTFKRLKLMRDVDRVVAEAHALIEDHALDLEEVRDVVLQDMLGEQYLPVDPREHEATTGG